MQRRQFACALGALAAATALGGARAQADDAAPVVGAAKIIEALRSKDIVLDGEAPAGRSRPARDPSISLQVQFMFGSSDLLPHGKRQLDQLAMALSDQALATAAFELAGHTDAVGDAQSNLRLSLERANAVKAYLTQAHGLPAARLQTIGFGFSRLADARQPTAAINRRVEVRRLRATAARPPQAPGTAQPPVPPGTGGRLVPTPQ